MLRFRFHFLFGVVFLISIVSTFACQRSEKPASNSSPSRSNAPVSEPTGTNPATIPGSSPVFSVPFNTPVAEEDPEIVAYFMKKGWHVGQYQHMTLPQMRSILTIENRDKVFEKIALSADDWKMIGRSKAVHALNLSKVKTDDDGLRAAARIPQLEVIFLAGEDVTNVGVKALAGCKSLEIIRLAVTKNVTDAGVRELAALPNLHILSLAMLHLDGSAFAAFVGSKKLHTVILEDIDGFTDEGGQCLAKLPNLTGLMIRTNAEKRRLTTAGIKAIVDVRMPPLFEFDKALIDDALFESLVAKGWLYGPSPPTGGSTSLVYGRSFEEKPATPEEVKNIDLDETKVTDKGVAALFRYPNISSISLQQTGITDVTLMNLSRFPKLKYLNVGKTKVTGSGLEGVAGLPIKDLHMELCDLSESAFQAIAKMASLENLDLYNAKTKGDWLKHISTLPNLKKLNAILQSPELVFAQATTI